MKVAIILLLFLAEIASAHADTTSWVTERIGFWSAVYGVSPDWMLSVAECESGLDPTVVGRYGEVGVFQILPPWAGAGIWESLPESQEGSPLDTDLNIKAAIHAHASGLSYAWSCG